MCARNDFHAKKIREITQILNGTPVGKFLNTSGYSSRGVTGQYNVVNVDKEKEYRRPLTEKNRDTSALEFWKPILTRNCLSSEYQARGAYLRP